MSKVHSKVNNITHKNLDNTYKHGSKTIDSIAVLSRIMKFAEGYKVMNYNDIVETDHR